MPFKSQAQRRKFAEMLVRGEISAETFEEWNRETGSAKLPERVTAKAKKKSSRKAAAAPKKTSSKKTSGRKKATKTATKKKRARG